MSSCGGGRLRAGAGEVWAGHGEGCADACAAAAATFHTSVLLPQPLLPPAHASTQSSAGRLSSRHRRWAQRPHSGGGSEDAVGQVRRSAHSHDQHSDRCSVRRQRIMRTAAASAILTLATVHADVAAAAPSSVAHAHVQMVHDGVAVASVTHGVDTPWSTMAMLLLTVEVHSAAGWIRATRGRVAFLSGGLSCSCSGMSLSSSLSPDSPCSM